MEVLLYATLALVGCAIAFKVIMRFGGVPHEKMLVQPETPIRRCVAGRPVKLVGRVVSAMPLTAPISGERCLFFEVWVEVRIRQNDGYGSQWKPVLRQTQRVDYLLLQDEQSDQAKIHLTGARIEGTVVEGDNEALIREEPPPRVSRLITKAGQTLNGLAGQPRLFRWGECFFSPQGAVAVLGRVSGAYRSGGAYRDGSQQVELGPLAHDKPLIVTDHVVAVR